MLSPLYADSANRRQCLGVAIEMETGGLLTRRVKMKACWDLGLFVGVYVLNCVVD